MGRPLTGKTHVGIRRETRSNGDVYVLNFPPAIKLNRSFV